MRAAGVQLRFGFHSFIRREQDDAGGIRGADFLRGFGDVARRLGQLLGLDDLKTQLV